MYCTDQSKGYISVSVYKSCHTSSVRNFIEGVIVTICIFPVNCIWVSFIASLPREHRCNSVRVLPTHRNTDLMTGLTDTSQNKYLAKHTPK